MPSLPPPTEQPVKVFALPTGQLTHPDRWLFEDGDEDILKARNPYPDYSFLIQHQASGKNVLFDLGLMKVRKTSPIHFATADLARMRISCQQ